MIEVSENTIQTFYALTIEKRIAWIDTTRGSDHTYHFYSRIGGQEFFDLSVELIADDDIWRMRLITKDQDEYNFIVTSNLKINSATARLIEEVKSRATSRGRNPK